MDKYEASVLIRLIICHKFGQLKAKMRTKYGKMEGDWPEMLLVKLHLC